MPTNFRRSRQVAPGVRVNGSKSGASVSFGIRGVRTCIGKHGITQTYGVPGTGVYHRELTFWEKLEEQRRQKQERKAKERESLNMLFAGQPLICMLSVACFAFGVISIFSTKLSGWWIVPAFICGIGLFVWASIRNDSSESVKNETDDDEYTTIHIPSFMKKYTPVMCNELFTTLQGYQDNQIEYVELTTSTIAELDSLLASNPTEL